MKLPVGFSCSGVCVGLKDSGRKDLGLIYAEKDCLAGAVYTLNRFPSAHVRYCRELTPSSSFRAIIVNSGNANAATGNQGLADNLKMANAISKQFDLDANQVLTASTGIIGVSLPINQIVDAIPALEKNLSKDGDDFSEAILTTDTRPKIVRREFEIEGRRYSATGFAKGAGMIEPNMGTMLAFVLTDAPLSPNAIQPLIAEVTDESFHCVTVDGDTSTNDSFFLISSNPVPDVSPKSAEIVQAEITAAAKSLSKQIAGDGEGIRHLIELEVRNAASRGEASAVLKAVLNSSLVKTAVYGNDPNWGRILMAAGKGLSETRNISISVQGATVFLNSGPSEFDKEELSRLMDRPEVRIEIDLKAGNASLTGWSCDLTREYVDFNAEYTT